MSIREACKTQMLEPFRGRELDFEAGYHAAIADVKAGGPHYRQFDDTKYYKLPLVVGAEKTFPDHQRCLIKRHADSRQCCLQEGHRGLCNFTVMPLECQTREVK